MKYNKRIVVDLDDTLSVTTNRDFKNAKPLQHVINKVNEFYDNGFEVVIQTARGQLSCNGDYKKADKKYRKQIEEWLNLNGVKYSYLTFNKILAQFYIDDKSVTPLNFSKTQVNQNKKGLSGAEVYTIGSKVYKTHDNAHNEVYWYNIVDSMRKPFRIPIIHSLVGKTITMDYIKTNKESQPLGKTSLVSVLRFFKSNNLTNSNWCDYLERVKSHAERNNVSLDSYSKMLSIKETMDENASFSHGDLTLENIIISEDNHVYLIDSIYNAGLFSSYLLDAAKYIYSLRLNDFSKEYISEILHLIVSSFNVKRYLILLLEITHWYRVLSYTDNKKYYIETIRGLENDIEKYL